MTDEELCRALRWKAGVYAKQAADRIEALVRERDKAALWATEQHASADSYALRLGQEKARAERLEEALRELVTCVEDGCFCSEMKMATAIDEARAALKGADHE